jgi:hypothetical protein
MLDMDRRMRAMDAEVYGDIYAEGGVFSGNLSVTGTLNVTGLVTFGASSLAWVNVGYAEAIMQDSGSDADMGLKLWTGHNQIGIYSGKATSGTGQYEGSVTASVDDPFVRTTGAQVELLAESDGGDWSLRVDPHNAKFNFEADGGDVLNVDPGGINMESGKTIEWLNASLPHIVLDSTSSGDSWTAQGAYLKIGEQASTEAGAAAISLSYVGSGFAYLGMGGMTSGVPAYGLRMQLNQHGIYMLGGTVTDPSYSWSDDTDMGFYRIANGRFGVAAQGVKVGEFGGYSGTSANYFNIRWGDGFVTRPSYSWFNDIDTGMYRFGTNEIGFAAGGGDNLLIGTYGIKINTSKDILPRSDNSSQLGASGARYIDVWAVDTSINSSDARYKTNLSNIPFDAMEFVRLAAPLKFKREGRNRWHLGWTAQQIKYAMDDVGFDWAAYIDPEVSGVPEGKREEDGFGHGPKGLRQAELVPVLWQAVIDLEARVRELENE